MASRGTGRHDRPARPRTHRDGSAWSARTVTVDTGMALAEVVPEHGRPWRRTLRLDGEDASHVDLRDPRHIDWAYVRRLADAADLVAPAGAPIDVVHVGGGGFTLPRYVAATRPGSRQEVAEVDRALVALAREHLGLRPSRALRVRVADGRAVLERREPASADLVVVDAFVAMEVPLHLTTVGFAALAHRVLRPGGWLAVNVVEHPPIGKPRESRARPPAAALAAAFEHLAVIATRKVLRGRQGGNVVLLAADRPLPVERLAARARRGPSPEVVLDGGAAAGFAAEAAPRYDSA
jgi:spermidine synthase